MKTIVEILRVFKVYVKAVFQLSYGVYRLRKLNERIVAVFGGKGAYQGGKYTEWAYEFSKKIVQHDISVITGGGPGIMEAANCGAYDAARDKSRATLGIGVDGVNVHFSNKCAPLIQVHYFFVRKWLLTHYACAYVFFPGGIGTVDEMFEALNLMKLQKIKRVPMILIGVHYWKDLIDWYQHGFESGLIEFPISNTLIITDSIDEAVNIIKASL